ncbi:hypothetical protein [Actinomadura sp. WMMA1423]|uniref:hypothetical protein n=1 Tax=Actinomadura sp. WMMA1423 TaxID=2591108 RepID=UPI001146E07A|nr:hypothetical protein [Actinomadura sp. WMMA1423]
MAGGATIPLLFVLVVAAGVIVILLCDQRVLNRKLTAEQMRADAAFDDARRARAAKVIADEQRERAVLGYGEVLAQVADLADHLRANHHDLVAKQLDRLVDDRTGTLRRL